MILQPISHRKIRTDRDAEGAQVSGQANSRQQQQVRPPVGAGGHDHLAVREKHLRLQARVR